MGPAVAPLIGIGSLDWRRPIDSTVRGPSRGSFLGWDGAPGVATKPRDQERYLRAELGSDWPLRIFPGARTPEGPAHENRDPAPDSGLLRRLARAFAGIL